LHDNPSLDLLPPINAEHTLDPGNLPTTGPGDEVLVLPAQHSTSALDAPYSAFGKRDKWIIVALTSFGSIFRCVHLCIEFESAGN
jgi:hypothetical protein